MLLQEATARHQLSVEVIHIAEAQKTRVPDFFFLEDFHTLWRLSALTGGLPLVFCLGC